MMNDGPKFDLEHRLGSYFETLRSPSLKQRLRRSTANWTSYAAATSSAFALLTGASASIVGTSIHDRAINDKQHFGTSQNAPLNRAMAQVVQTMAPSINAGGVVPLDGNVSVIQPGEWVTIFGKNLASQTASWMGDFPTSLGGTTVEINGKAAYLSFVSSGQINLQAPDDTARGAVSVVVTTSSGIATATVILNEVSPTFSLLDARHIIGIILRSDGSGAYGNGTYDILGPTGSCYGYSTVAAKAGDEVELFGVGFGPTDPVVPAGVPFSGAAPVTNAVSLFFDNTPI